MSSLPSDILFNSINTDVPDGSPQDDSAAQGSDPSPSSAESSPPSPNDTPVTTSQASSSPNLQSDEASAGTSPPPPQPPSSTPPSTSANASSATSLASISESSPTTSSSTTSSTSTSTSASTTEDPSSSISSTPVLSAAETPFSSQPDPLPTSSPLPSLATTSFSPVSPLDSSTSLASSTFSESTSVLAGQGTLPTAGADSADDSSTNTAAIAAPVVVGAVLLPCIILLFVWWRRKRRHRGVYQNSNRSHDTEMSNPSVDGRVSLQGKHSHLHHEVRGNGTAPAPVVVHDQEKGEPRHTHPGSRIPLGGTSRHDMSMAGTSVMTRDPSIMSGSLSAPLSQNPSHVTRSRGSPPRKPVNPQQRFITTNGDEITEIPSVSGSASAVPKSILHSRPTMSELPASRASSLDAANGYGTSAPGRTIHGEDHRGPETMLPTPREGKTVNDDGISEMSVSSHYSRPQAGHKRMSDEISTVSSLADITDDRDELSSSQHEKRASRRSMPALAPVDEGEGDRESDNVINGR